MFQNHILCIADQIRDITRRHAALKQEPHKRVPENVRRRRTAFKGPGNIKNTIDSPPPKISYGL